MKNTMLLTVLLLLTCTKSFATQPPVDGNFPEPRSVNLSKYLMIIESEDVHTFLRKSSYISSVECDRDNSCTVNFTNTYDDKGALNEPQECQLLVEFRTIDTGNIDYTTGSTIYIDYIHEVSKSLECQSN